MVYQELLALYQIHSPLPCFPTTMYIEILGAYFRTRLILGIGLAAMASTVEYYMAFSGTTLLLQRRSKLHTKSSKTISAILTLIYAN